MKDHEREEHQWKEEHQKKEEPEEEEGKFAENM